MKLQLELLIIASLFAYACATTCTDDDWSMYKEKYKKTYNSPEDELQHHNTYCETIKAIDKHNEGYKRGESTYTMGVNQFADLTSEEMSSYFGLIQT